MIPSASSSPLVDAARALTPRLLALSPEIEKARRLPPELVRELAQAGLLRMSVPRELGGPEVDGLTQLEVIEQLARGDAAAGWCAMIGSSSALACSYLPRETLDALFGRDPLASVCGVFAPLGKAVPVEGGFRVTGRWPFASGCEHSAWRIGGALVEEGPEVRWMVFPAEDTRILDTWSVSGLRGTGSHDLAVEGAFVPAARSFSIFTERPAFAGPLYAFPIFGFLAMEVAAVGLGIARAAIDAFVELARGKVASGGRRPISHRAVIQLQVARAEALWGSGRALLRETVRELWAAASAGAPLDVPQRARLRLACTHAVTSSAQAVDLMYEAGGGTSIYESCPLQRHFRDVHAVTQHVMVSPVIHELVGKALLGLEIDASQL